MCTKRNSALCLQSIPYYALLAPDLECHQCELEQAWVLEALSAKCDTCSLTVLYCEAMHTCIGIIM